MRLTKGLLIHYERKGLDFNRFVYQERDPQRGSSSRGAYCFGNRNGEPAERQPDDRTSCADGIAERGLGYPPLPRDLLYESIEATLIDLLSGPEPVTAVACQQDVQLELLLEACFRLNISIPGELAILSFTNLPAGQPLLGNVHRLVQRATELGNSVAAQEFLARQGRLL